MTHAHRAAVIRDLTQRMAYQLWVRRGRPFGSPEVDWFRAEILLHRFASIWTLAGFEDRTDPSQLASNRNLVLDQLACSGESAIAEEITQ